jgi:4-hydroxybenzoate polyprenyltransferase
MTPTASAYYVLTLAYSRALKRHAMIDVVVVAALYMARIIAGAAAIDVPLTFWLLPSRCSRS